METHPKIIAFEGIDGSGKTVQMQRFHDFLLSRNLTVDILSFPQYQSFFGKEIGKLLSCAEGVAADTVDAKSMALWFALDRFEAFRNFHTDADVLLLNRYVLSNAVYQSIRDRDLNHPDILDFVLELEHEHFHLPKPDLYFILDVEIESAGKNVEKKGFRDYTGNEEKDVYERQTSIQFRARQKYLDYADKIDSIRIIPCMQNGILKPEDEIAGLIQAEFLKSNM